MFRILKQLALLLRPRTIQSELDQYIHSRNPQSNADVEFHTKQFEHRSKVRSAWWAE